MSRKIYTFTFIKTVTGNVTVRASDNETAAMLAIAEIEDLRHADNYEEDSADMTMIDLKEVDAEDDYSNDDS